MILGRFAIALAALLSPAGAALAAPVNGTGNLTSEVIFGSGNLDGSFTGTTASGVELALRAKLRYDLSGNPQNIFNYDGDRTYTFDPAQSVAPADRSVFNFEWSINTDASGTTGLKLNDLSYLLSIDYDPGANTATTVDFDPINVAFADHALGTSATANGGGIKAVSPATYSLLIDTLSVAQNSWNLGFFEPTGFDPQTEGLYTISLSAFRGTDLLAETSIDIQVGDVTPVPVPAPFLLLGTALAGLVLLRRRSA